MPINRREFIQISALPVAGALAFPAAAAAQDTGPLLRISLDVVLQPSQGSPTACGIAEPALWLMVRPSLIFERDGTAEEHTNGRGDWNAFLKSLNGGPISQVFEAGYQCQSQAESEKWHHVTLPKAWNIHLELRTADGVVVKQTSVLRASRLALIDPTAYQIHNNGVPEAAPLQAHQCLSSENVRNWVKDRREEAFAAVFNQAIEKACEVSPTGNVCGPDGPPNSQPNATHKDRVAKAIGQMNLALTLGSRRYASAAMFRGLDNDPHVMRLRGASNAADALIETNIHSLLGLAIHLASGTAAIQALASVRTVTLAFSAEETPDWNNLGVRVLSRESDLFECLGSLDPSCTALPASFDVLDNDVPFASAVLAQQSLTQSQILIEQAASEDEEFIDYFVTAPEPPLEETVTPAPVKPRPIQDYLLLGTRAELNAAASTLNTEIQGFSVATLRLEPFRRYARLFRLLPLDPAGQEFLDEADRARSDNSLSPLPIQGAIADWSAGSTYMDVDPSSDRRTFALSGMMIVVVSSLSPRGALPAGAYLDVDPGKPAPVRLRLLKNRQSGKVNAKARPEIVLSPGANESADSTLVARPLVWTTTEPPRIVVVRLGRSTKREAARALCSRLVYRFANDFELTLAQSLGSACVRVAVDYGFNEAAFACEAERYAEIVRESALGDRRSYTALNVYEKQQLASPQHVEIDPLRGAGHSGWLWRNPQMECYPWKTDNACDPSPSSRFRARFWTQISEAIEFRADIWAHNNKTRNPEALVREVREFYSSVYRRAGSGARKLRFTAEGTFGVERDLDFSQPTGVMCAVTPKNPTLPSTADWPIMHLADASMVDTPALVSPGKSPSEPASIPLLSFSMSADDGLRVNFNSCALLPPPDLRWPKDDEGSADERERQRGPMLAFFRSWQALAELNDAETVELLISRFRFDFRALVNKRNTSGFVLDLPFQLVDDGAISLSLQSGPLVALRAHVKRLLSGEIGVQAMIDGRADWNWSVLTAQQLERTHVVGMQLTLRRGLQSAPALNTNYQVVHMGSPGEPLDKDAAQADRLVPLGDTEFTRNALENYLKPRRSVTKLVRRHRNPGETSRREGFMRALGLNHARFKAMADSAGEWVVPRKVATPDSPDAKCEVAVIPLAFRSPVRLAKLVGGNCDVLQLDERLGTVAFEPLMKLIEALDPLVAGTWKTPNRHVSMLAGFEECAPLVDRWIDELSQLIAPVHAAPKNNTDDNASVREVLRDWGEGNVAPWVVAWCKQQLLQSPRFFVDTALVLFVRIAGTSSASTVPSDFARLDLTFARAGIYEPDMPAEPSKTGPKLTYTVLPSDLVEISTGVYGALVPVTFSDAAAYLDWEGGRAFRVEHELNRWSTAVAGAPVAADEQIPIARFAAPANVDPQKPDIHRMRIPARSPAPAPRVMCAGKAVSAIYTGAQGALEDITWNGAQRLNGRFHTARRIEGGLAPLAALPIASALHRRAAIWSESPRVLAVDEYVARYVVVWQGDRYSADQDATDVVRVRLRPPQPTLTEGLKSGQDRRERTVIDALMELRDPKTFDRLPALVFDGVLRCSERAENFDVELPGDGALSPCVMPGQSVDPTPDQSALQIRIGTRDGQLFVTRVNGCTDGFGAACAPVSAALFGTRSESEEADDKQLGLTSTLYLAVDFVQSRWTDLVLAAQIERNPPGDSTEWPMSPAFLSLSDERLVPFVAAAAPEIGAWDTADRKTVARLPLAQLNWQSLLAALFNMPGRPHLADMDTALRGAASEESVVLSFFHRQQLSAWEITNNDEASLTPLTEPSYAALERNLLQLTGDQRQPDAALAPVVAAAARGVRNFAVDIEWRDAKGRTRLRLSKWAFDLS